MISKRAPWMEIPPMESLFGKFEGGRLVGLIGAQRPVVVECLIADSGKDMRDLVLWLDGKLNPFPYFFFIKDPKFQGLVDSHYADNLEGFEGKLYWRRR